MRFRKRVILLAMPGLCACSNAAQAPSLVEIPPRPVVSDTDDMRNAEIEGLIEERETLRRTTARMRREQNAESELHGDR